MIYYIANDDFAAAGRLYGNNVLMAAAIICSLLFILSPLGKLVIGTVKKTTNALVNQASKISNKVKNYLASKRVDRVLGNKTHTNNTARVRNYQSPITGNEAARADFNSLNPTNVRTYPNGTKVGNLSDGRVVNIHPSSSSNGVPTLEIFNPTTNIRIKIRY